MIWRMLIFELVAVIVVAGVWFGAPLIGLTSVLWRIVIILALLVPPIVLIVWNFFRERKAAAGLETAIKEQGKAHRERVRPDRRQEIEVLSDVFEKAIVALKKSKVGGLYALPWYMIIGPPAAGKSTALLHSGLKFPFTTGDRKAVKGVGGTRNCDWWFSDQAILLDTAGRYTSEEEDQEEWIAFLKMVKRYRKKRPLNGLIVAVSVADLMKASPEEVEEMAGRLRSRVDQVIEELDLALPVYVLFTKCDLISGFIQFFGDLTKTSRSQILGFTVPLTTGETNVEQLFNEEFDLLVDRVRQRSLARLATAKSGHRREVYQFPLQFGAARDAYAALVTHLMVANPYLETPRLRGVYWCSGTQEGRPVDKVMAVMSRALGLRELASEGFEQATQKKSYFLRDVFTQVLFPDQNLAGTSAVGRSRKKKLGIVAIAASALVSAAVLTPAVISFGNNRHLASSTVDVARRSRITTPEDPRKVLDGLRALDQLGANLDTLFQYDKSGPPWWLGLGFYQGNKLLEPVEKIYIRRMRQAFVLPAGTELEATLQDVAHTADSMATAAAAGDFDLLKTYLMVIEPGHLEAGFAAPMLLTQWKKRLHPDVAQESELLTRNAKRYLALIKSGKAKWLDADRDLVRSVRQALRARRADYLWLLGDSDKVCRKIVLTDLTERVQTVLNASTSVPGAYTRHCWQTYIQLRLATQLAGGSRIEPWVLGDDTAGDATARLKAAYFEQYIAAWKNFIGGLKLEEAPTPADSLRVLEKLSENAPQPVYVVLFKNIAHNTEMPPVEMTAGLQQEINRTKAGQILKRVERVTGKKLKGPQNAVETYFQPLRELAVPPALEGGRAPISGVQQYITQLQNVHDELKKEIAGQVTDGGVAGDKAVEEAQRVTKGILSTLPGDLRRLVEPLFYGPLELSRATAGDHRVKQASGAMSDLCKPFAENLAHRYPFAKSRDDASIQDVLSYFAPTGTVWTNETFKTQVVRQGDVFQAAPGRTVPKHIVTFFNAAWKITRAIFPMGSDRPMFRFQVRPRPAVLEAGSTFQISEVILEVEGKTQTYRNGPMEQWSFEWTGQPKQARLLVRGSGGLYEDLRFQGEWALMRLVERGTVQRRGSWYAVEWSLKGGKLKIPMEFRPDRSFNPLFMPMRLTCR